MILNACGASIPLRLKVLNSIFGWVIDVSSIDICICLIYIYIFLYIYILDALSLATGVFCHAGCIDRVQINLQRKYAHEIGPNYGNI